MYLYIPIEISSFSPKVAIVEESSDNIERFTHILKVTLLTEVFR